MILALTVKETKETAVTNQETTVLKRYTSRLTLIVSVSFPSCVDTRYPEPQPDGAAGQA